MDIFTNPEDASTFNLTTPNTEESYVASLEEELGATKQQLRKVQEALAAAQLQLNARKQRIQKQNTPLPEYCAELERLYAGHKKLLDASLDVICAFDQLGRFIQVNAASETVLGYKPEELLGRKYLELLYEEDVAATQEIGLATMAGAKFTNFENRYRHRDGTLIPLAWSARWDFNEKIMYCVARDASEKKATGEALRQSENRYRQLFVSNPLPMWVYDCKTLNFLEVNDAAIRKYGYTQEEFLAMSITAIRPREDVLQVFQLANELSKKKGIYQSRWHHQTKGGAIISVEITSHYMSYNGKETRLVLSNDITEKIAIEEALLKSNERFNFATAATNDAIWDLDLKTNHIHWGVGFERNFGFDTATDNHSFAFWEKQVHPEDKERVSLSLEQAISDKAVSYWREEYRFRRADQTFAYVVDQGNVIRDKNGNGIRMVGALQDITARRRTEEELRKLSFIAEETPNAIILINARQEITWVNKAFTQISEYTLDDVLGKNPDSFLPGPESDQETLQYIQNQINAAQPAECEIVHYTKSGRKYWVRTQIQPVLDEKGKLQQFFFIQTDITRQKAEEQQLKLLESVITNATDAIIITEGSLIHEGGPNILYVNPAFTKTTGYSPEEIIGQTPQILHGPATDAQVLATIKKHVEQGEPYEVEILNYKKNGEEFWSNIAIKPVTNPAGTITHWISIQRNITARKKYEAERDLLIEQLTQTNADLRQFSYITSHNLRAPLSNLQGLIKLINRDALADDFNRTLIEKFELSTNQLNKTIHDLLDILIIKNNFNVKRENLCLKVAFADVLKSIENLIRKEQAHISTSFTTTEVFCNAGYLHSILLNLVTNALKYRSPDRQLHISLKTEITEGFVELHFSDNGKGLDLKRYGDRIFGLYQRFHSHSDSKGLGLYITHSQIKAMGGTITMQSEVNKGATFIVRFRPATHYD